MYIFQKVESAFLWAVKDTLGDRYTISIENVYTITIRFIITNLDESFSNHRQVQLNGCKVDKICPKTTDTNEIIPNDDLAGEQIANNVPKDYIENIEADDREPIVECNVNKTDIKDISAEPDEQHIDTGQGDKDTAY